MDVTIATGNGSIGGYLVEPEQAPGPWPGVVVVHDVAGLTTDTKAITARFATAGYLAVAPDLYGRGGLARCVRTVFRQLQAGTGQAHDDIDAARTLLTERAGCTGKVGVVGFCLGGGFALLAATRQFDASAPYYGELPDPLSILDGACPVVASFGAKDKTLRGAADRLETALTEYDVPHDVKEYPDAGHSFANRIPAGPFNALLKVTGFSYHHESSEDAWRRVLAFFSTHLSSNER